MFSGARIIMAIETYAAVPLHRKSEKNMALEKVSTILKMADAANTSAIGFNCNDYTMAYSVVQVAEELQKPVIVMLYPPDNFESNCCGVAGFAAPAR